MSQEKMKEIGKIKPMHGIGQPPMWSLECDVV